MDVSRQMLEVFIGIYQQGFETSLKQMSAALPLDIEIDGVTDIDPLDSLTQVCPRGFHQKVVVLCEVPHYVKFIFQLGIHPSMFIAPSSDYST